MKQEMNLQLTPEQERALSKKQAKKRRAGYLAAKYAVAVILIVFFMFPYLLW